MASGVDVPWIPSSTQLYKDSSAIWTCTAAPSRGSARDDATSACAAAHDRPPLRLSSLACRMFSSECYIHAGQWTEAAGGGGGRVQDILVADTDDDAATGGSFGADYAGDDANARLVP
ncbi:putative vitellogenin receptor [Drosophila madeirensis]|uniref:Vitellogenin receptor n=1 Tax=Drosophila madeirensis TaxID=30013 RepID=A0AAU9FZ15_DROMD